jgi:long-chain acyl-CoA synthetase
MHTTDYISPQEAKTLHGLFLKRVEKTPQGVAYRYYDKTRTSWAELTWQEMSERVSIWQQALASEKLNPGARVALMLPNSPEWVCFDMAALSLGLVVVPLFANDRPQNIAYILEQTNSRLLLCPGLAYWQDLKPVLHRLTHIQRIVTLDHCKIQKNDLRIICSSDWLPHTSAEVTLTSISGNDLATIVYTSGTTGRPKGVMLSHKNILENSYAGLQTTAIYPDDLLLSFLPMSHMLERTVGYYLAVAAGATVAFVRSIAHLAEDLKEIRPTAMVAVPRVFEGIYGKILASLDQKSFLLKKLFSLAVEVGWNRFEFDQKRRKWSIRLLFHPVLDRLVASKVRMRLGGRLRVIISGGAPLSTDIAKVFLGFGLPLLQGYGLTETSPVVSVNRLENNNPSGVGLPLPGVETKLTKEGELLVRGSCVMLGYWQDDEATRKMIDTTGWLHTGDKAEIKNGHIFITGRLKEIIVLSNSEKVPPADIEMAVCTDPLFDQAMIIGENKPFLVMVAVVNPDQWKTLCLELNIEAAESMLNSEVVHKVVLKKIEQQMASFPGFAKVKKVVLTLEPWTVDNDLLTPTLKIKREKIKSFLQQQIDEMYEAGPRH